MTVCDDCHQEMDIAQGCSGKKYLVAFSNKTGNIKSWLRNADYGDNNERCATCGRVNKPGNIHHFGCDIERCPVCHCQLISCECFDGLDLYVNSKPELPEGVK
jgi:hypothetical protein